MTIFLLMLVGGVGLCGLAALGGSKAAGFGASFGEVKRDHATVAARTKSERERNDVVQPG
jgi:hypothetical protein